MSTNKETKKKDAIFFDDYKAVQEALQTIERTTQAYKYKYTDLPTVWESIREAITKNNFIVYHLLDKEGVHTFAQHAAGEKLHSFIEYSSNLKPQDKGSEISYYRRYNITAIFNVISGDEDDDGTSAQGGEPSKSYLAKVEKAISEIDTVDHLEKYFATLGNTHATVIELFRQRKEKISE